MDKFKRFTKYEVFKIDDIEGFLDPAQKASLKDISRTIDEGRHREGKKCNTYVVVNEDQPYAEKVWMLIERQVLLDRLDVIKHAYNSNDYLEEKEEIELRLFELDRWPG